MTATGHIDIAQLKQVVASSTTGDVTGLNSVREQLQNFANSADSESQQDLADSATVLAQLVELAEICTNDDLTSQLLAYVESNLNVLTNEVEVEDFLSATQKKWAKYLEVPNDSEAQDPWDSSDVEVAPEAEEFQHDSDQMQLLLSVMTTNEPSNQQTQNSVRSDARITTEDDLSELLADEELREAYIDDASRCLESMEKCSLEAEQNPSNTEAVQQFCRELHTLKGASASVGLSQIADQIHHVESDLEKDLSHEKSVELMFGIADKVRGVFDRLQPQSNSNPSPANTAEAPTEQRVPTQTLSNADFSVGSANDSLVRIRASKLDRLMDMLAELVVLRNRRESNHAAFAELNVELNRSSSRLNFYAQDPTSETGSLSGSCTLSELSKDLSDLSTELRELQKPINKDNLAISHFIRDFRHELMQLRRIPLAGLFNRVQRSARDAAKTEGKQVTFAIEGHDSSLERELQEKLFEPLLHVVRNAVSHGIESPEERKRLGKQPAGVITLKAQSNSQMVVITVSDDGKGLDYEAIRKRGVEKGLIGQHQTLSEAELGGLIFHPGFSTRASASSVSGRGVGMDVVMNVLKQMRGRIEIESQPGQGSTMMIVIPVQSGIEHVMVFRSGGQVFAMPMQSVSKVHSSGSANTSAVNMAAVLGKTSDETPIGKDILMLRSHASESGKRTGFAVDEILGPEEVVIRKLPPLLRAHPMFCGLTLTGAGDTALLLDPDRLSKFNQSIHAANSVVVNAFNDTKTELLVVDDSLSARKLLKKKLMVHGFHVTEAGDGMEALEKIRNQKFDLIFTDLDMPRLGGLELLFDLQQGQNKDQKVVVLSSRAADEFKDRAMELGALAYLTKPVEDESLNRVLSETGLLTQN